MSGYFGGGGGGSAVTESWWHHHAVMRLIDATFQNGAILSGGHLTAALLAGSADIGGATGLGGQTETARLCSAVGDETPTAAQQRGIWVDGGTAGPTPNYGYYGAVSARFPIANDQSLFFGYVLGIGDPDTASGAYRQIMFSKKSSQTNWYAHIYDGSTHAETDTGVAWGAADWRNFEIVVYINAGVLTAYFYIDGVLVHTYTAATTGFPAGDSLMDLMVGTHFDTLGDTVTFDQVFFLDRLKWYGYNNMDPSEWAT